MGNVNVIQGGQVKLAKLLIALKTVITMEPVIKVDVNVHSHIQEKRVRYLFVLTTVIIMDSVLLKAVNAI